VKAHLIDLKPNCKTQQMMSIPPSWLPGLGSVNICAHFSPLPLVWEATQTSSFYEKFLQGHTSEQAVYDTAFTIPKCAEVRGSH
jgi:hypothetical protein